MKKMQLTKRILINFIHLFFPRLCLLCRTPLIQEEKHICLDCLCDLPLTNFHTNENNPVFQLLTGKVDIVSATAWLHYEKGAKVQRLVHSFKYYNNKNIAYQLGRQMGLSLHSYIINQKIDCLIPVPLHKKRRRQRGYNQSEWICKGLASVIHIPVCTNGLQRKTASDTQTKKSLYARWTNVQQLFVLNDKQDLEGKHILLIDDVVTSGSTLGMCVKTLQEVSGIKISILALAAA
ncbi:MAG: ComF family protein [Tannerellaceae bacterium]|jgi:ComF family protein|nr:ComF family protein [Tannerellaceae bacterium]